MSADGTHSSTAGLVLRSLAASLWFALVFFVALPGGILYATGGDLLPPPGPGLWLGVALMLAAHLGVARLVAVFIREGHGTHAPLSPPRRLVLSGIYRYTRNPMYLLYTLVILGEALAWRSAWLGVYTLGFWLLAHVYVLLGEEPRLRRRFGPAYDSYRQRVPRWLPLRRGRVAGH